MYHWLGCETVPSLATPQVTFAKIVTSVFVSSLNDDDSPLVLFDEVLEALLSHEKVRGRKTIKDSLVD